MSYLILKFSLSAALLVAVSELARRNSWAGAMLASLPLTTLVAMAWMHWDGASNTDIALLSKNVFWLVLASLPMFWVLAVLLETGWRFVPAVLACAAGTALMYAACTWALGKLD
jgi:hypothetical protein